MHGVPNATAEPLSCGVSQPALVPRRTTTTSGLVRQALVDALIGAVLDEMGAVGVSRTTPAATQNGPKPEISTRERRGMR